MEYEMTELLPVAAWLTDRYTGKESGSVTYETANQLMEAVLYCIEEQERGYQTADAAAVSDPSGRPDGRAAYEAGYECAFQKVVKAKELYECIMKDFCSYGNISYDETVRKGMPEFFLHYDVRFCPQDHILTLDYPVLVDLSGICGIDRIYRYLKCIYMEQMFLSRFPEMFVRGVLTAQNPDYKSMFLNISSMVLRHVEGSMLIGKPIQEMTFKELEYLRIRELLSGMEAEELQQELGLLLGAVLNQGFADKEGLFKYLSADIPEFRAALYNAAEHDCLKAVL